MSIMINVLPTGRRTLTWNSVIAAAAGVTAVGLVGGVAYAAWSVSATGSSQATSGTPVTGTVTVATPVDSLYPGGTTPVYFTVTNPNSFPVTYTAATFGTVTVDDATACPASNVTTANQAVSISVAAKTTSTVQSPAGAISMASDAPNGCQGRTFTVATTLSGASS
jgi:hypothetical protein